MIIQKANIRGSKIAAYRIGEVRMVSITVAVKAGAKYEKNTQSGYFHLLEHLMLTGTKKFENWKKLNDYAEEYGINFGASTARDQMIFWFDFPDIYLKNSFSLIEEILFHSIINFENFENEISVIEQEYKDKWNNPYNCFSAVIEKSMAGKNCNLINRVLGDPENVKRATRNNLKKLYKKYFVPQNLCWGISGNFNWNKTKKLLSRIIPKGVLAKNNPDFKISNWEPNFKKITYKAKIDQPYIHCIWQLPSFEKYSLTKKHGNHLFNYMLGSGRSSRLFTRIRQDLGLAYGVESALWTWSNFGYLDISVSTDVRKINIVIDEIERVVNRFFTEEINTNNFQRAMKFVDLATLTSFYSPKNISKKLVDQLFYDEKVYTPKQMNTLAHKMNIDKIQKWFRDNVSKEKELIAIMVPENLKSGSDDNQGKKS